MSRTFTWSTREMPETAASPTVETITVSAIPTVTSKSCSSTKGRISLQSA